MNLGRMTNYDVADFYVMEFGVVFFEIWILR